MSAADLLNDLQAAQQPPAGVVSSSLLDDLNKYKDIPYTPPVQANADETDAQFFHRIGNSEDPNYIYGNFSPTKTAIDAPIIPSYFGSNRGVAPSGTKQSELAFPEQAYSMARGIGDLLSSGQNGAPDATPDSVNAMIGLAGMPSMMRGGVGAIEGGAAKLGELMADKSPTGADYQAAINKTYQAAQASKAPFYNFMNDAAAGHTIDPSAAVEHAKSLISEIGTNPLHPNAPLLGRLNNFVDTYEGKTEMPLADAVEMQQDINGYFKANKFSQGAKTPYFQLSSALDEPIEQAAASNPIFGQAKDLADKNYVDNVANAFTQNKLLKPFWQPQDYYAANSVENGLASYLPDETRLRANSMVGNIDSPEQLDAVTRAMPPEIAAQFRQAVLKNTTSGSGMYRIQQLGNYLGEPLVPKHIFNALRGQTYNEADTALINAAKKPSPSLTNYQDQLGALKTAVPDKTPLLTYQPQQPESEMLGGQQGLIPATPQQLLAAQMQRQRAGEMGMYPAQGIQNPENIAPAQVAATKGQSPMLARYGSAKMQGNENLPPLPEQSSAGMMGNVEYIKYQQQVEAKKLADQMLAGPTLDVSREELTPETVQEIFKNRRDIANITGQNLKNPDIQEALLAAFKRKNQ